MPPAIIALAQTNLEDFFLAGGANIEGCAVNPSRTTIDDVGNLMTWAGASKAFPLIVWADAEAVPTLTTLLNGFRVVLLVTAEGEVPADVLLELSGCLPSDMVLQDNGKWDPAPIPFEALAQKVRETLLSMPATAGPAPVTYAPQVPQQQGPPRKFAQLDTRVPLHRRGKAPGSAANGFAPPSLPDEASLRHSMPEPEIPPAPAAAPKEPAFTLAAVVESPEPFCAALAPFLKAGREVFSRAVDYRIGNISPGTWFPSRHRAAQAGVTERQIAMLARARDLQIPYSKKDRGVQAALDFIEEAPEA